MKKKIALTIALVCVLSLVGCQKTTSGSEVYSFPEPTTQITGIFYSQGQETAFEIGSENYAPDDLSTTSVIEWFYGLKLTACDKPEAVAERESYDFYIKGEYAFIYEYRGSEAYIIIGGNYYKVANPSTPPINFHILSKSSEEVNETDTGALPPMLTINGVNYFASTTPIAELPDDYECLGEITEKEANDTGLHGCKYYANKYISSFDEFYLYQECGTPIDENTVDSSQRQWAYVKWVREGLCYGK